MGLSSQWNFGKKVQQNPLLLRNCSILFFSVLESKFLLSFHEALVRALLFLLYRSDPLPVICRNHLLLPFQMVSRRKGCLLPGFCIHSTGNESIISICSVTTWVVKYPNNLITSLSGIFILGYQFLLLQKLLQFSSYSMNFVAHCFNCRNFSFPAANSLSVSFKYLSYLDIKSDIMMAAPLLFGTSIV